MKFQCAACGLRLDGLHFKTAGLMTPKLTSLCDLCRGSGLDAADFPNEAVQVVAAVLLYPFVGQTGTTAAAVPIKKSTKLWLGAAQKPIYEALIQDYDGNDLARQQISRTTFNQAVLDSTQDKKKQPSPQMTLAENLTRLGLKVTFQLNEVTYLDRERVRVKYHYRCQYCGRYGKSVDHKAPVSLSHDNDFSNLTLSCSECNRIKGNMPYALFVRLNDQLKGVNKKLVDYEKTLIALKHELNVRRQNLHAAVHLKGVTIDPELQKLRRKNKQLQDAVDSLQSDYDQLRQARKMYFETGWKLDRASHEGLI